MSIFVINGIISIIQTISNIFILLVIFSVFLPYFLSPTNKFREFVDRIVNPFFILLRRYIPPLGRFDFTPVILVILVQLITILLTGLLANLIK
jgi:YggT family protein